MARGYPDYFGQSIFPYYGPWSLYNWGAAVDASAVTELINYTGKGVLVAGHLYVRADLSQRNGIVRIHTDGNYLGGATISSLLDYGLDRSSQGLVFLNEYNLTDGYFSVLLGVQISFGNNLVWEYEEVAGSTPWIGCALYIARIL